MRNIALVVAVAVATVSTPALAANSGPYIGVGVTHDNVAGGGDAEGLGINGIGGTVFAGFDMPMSESTFVGVEANFDLASAKVGDATDSFEADNAYGATARFGANLNDSVAIYVRAGYQRGRASTVVEGVKVSESRDGLRLGGGLEAAITDRVSLRAEYNRTHYYANEADQMLAESDNIGLNNDQFSLAVVYGF